MAVLTAGTTPQNLDNASGLVRADADLHEAQRGNDVSCTDRGMQHVNQQEDQKIQAHVEREV